MRRHYPKAPLIGVGGIIFQNDTVLLIKRRNPPGAGKWSIPGGLVEVGERLVDAIKREVKEETGLEVAVKEMVDLVERIITDEHNQVEYHYVIVDFLCQPIGGHLQVASDAKELQWLPLKELENFDINTELKEILKKAYNLWTKNQSLP